MLSSRSSSHSRLSQEFSSRVRSLLAPQDDVDEPVSPSSLSFPAPGLSIHKNEGWGQLGQRTSSLHLTKEEFKKPSLLSPVSPPTEVLRTVHTGKEIAASNSAGARVLPTPLPANNAEEDSSDLAGTMADKAKHTEFIDTELIKGMIRS